MRHAALVVLAALAAAACSKSEAPKPQAAAPAAPALKQGEQEVGSGKVSNAMDPRNYAGMMEQAQKTADAANAVQSQKIDAEKQADQQGQ